ncbi:capping protein-inhibiting regulator of actin dynamics isoform X3 [Saimiri boliviensis]|uniref:capping protein-inhibiting regulator of actin dynamics isoform X3 n=1 Tax=Saimiri boliviensis TaxID=27679 RepID=UPI00193CBF3F|nr:capping protein inhibiting regulator of actin dynamics isoform X1 [Saimiri boliviensis boliviensis]
MGSRAFSHDSIFIPDGGAESEQTVQAMSQDNILGKVKTLQQQLGKNIKFGQRPPNAIPMKKANSGEASLEEDLFLTSPMEIVTQQDIILSDAENKSSDTPSSLSPLNLPGAGSEMEEKVAPVKPSRPKRHFSSAGTIESVNLDAIPLAIARLDNSAAKHKLAVKPKNQRVSKKHRRLAQDPRHEQGGLESRPSLDQNGHPGEDKPTWHEEEPSPLDSEEERRRQEDYWRELEAKCRRQKAEAAEKRRLEEQRLQALERRLWEENRRQELLEEEGEGQEPPLEADRAPREEPRRRSLEAPSWEDPARREREERERLEAEEERRRLQAQAEERRRPEEDARLEERRRQEEEEGRHAEELRRQEEEEAQRREELEQQEEVQGPPEAAEEVGEAQQGPEEENLEEEEEGEEEQGQAHLEDERGQLGALLSDFEENPEEQEHRKPEGQREHSEEPSVCEEQNPEAERAREQQQERSGDVQGPDHPGPEQEREEGDTEPPPKPEGTVEAAHPPVERKEAAVPEQGRKVEELRWQEVDERQSMPRPYTFQVSSGGKQILFPKVNLSPVTPAKDTGPTAAPQEPKAPKASPAAHALPSSLSVPHTAILVTGAQLCGPAVNLSQIKDTACKSLLGLSEEKRHADTPAAENPPRGPGDARTGSGKAKPPQEPPSSAAALAEWASIRSRILKNAESDPRSSERDPSRPGEEPTPRGRCDSRGNLRKTPPVNAKFSIKPAWQKFSDGGTETSRQNMEAEGIRKKPLLGPGEETAPQPPSAGVRELGKGPEKSELHREPADTTEGCKFAKDLPSFLVPSLPYSPQKVVAHTESATSSDSETTNVIAKPDPVMPGGEEKTSPFGIKLRRTNYSLRFNCDQQAEQKKKKRHSSTGDSVDAGPPAVGSAAGEKEAEGVSLRRGPSLPQERKQAPSIRRDSAEPPSSRSPPVAQPGPPPASSQTPAPEHDKATNKMPLAQKPALAPKPTSQTPPASPLSKLSRPYLVELLSRRAGRPDPEPSEPSKEGQESSDHRPPSPPGPEERKGQKRDEEEDATKRKPASPPLPAAQQVKPSQTPEAGRKEKPMLQSRHSLDGSKLTEKVETAQPLWITLALQKQKGFREQQATREERKQAREVKQAEKFSKENVSVSPQPASSTVSRAGSLHKSAPPEEKRPETAVSRLERREQLTKANTLPTSVTVEISDSAPPAPLVKEVTKRFSTPDAAPVSTEPAWLALAKRKAKAWSDCPQIIK